MPLRRLLYDARHDILKCLKSRVLRPLCPVVHGRFFFSTATDCRTCPHSADCLSKGRVNKAVVVSDNHRALLLQARRRKEAWSEENARLYQRRRWRAVGLHGEAKCWHSMARAVRRRLQNMRIQAYLTAAAVNLKRLAAALVALLRPWPRSRSWPICSPPSSQPGRGYPGRTAPGPQRCVPCRVTQRPHAAALPGGAHHPPDCHL